MEEDHSSVSLDEYYSSESDEQSIFEGSYRCYPVNILNKPNLETGNKIIMPPSALEELLDLEVNWPMLFEMEKFQNSNGKVSHCGVLEFTAEEGKIYVPSWMMENMQLQDGEIVNMRSTSLAKGTFFKLQPHTKDFLDMSNPKAILETSLRSFPCLTTGDTIMIAYNNKKYFIDVVETKPSHGISIIDTDCEVDFAQPLDYKEPENKKHPEVEDKPVTKTGQFIPFTGCARRLDGKPSSLASEQTCSMLKQEEADKETKSSDSKPSNTTTSRRTNGKLVLGSNSEPNANTPKVETPTKASLKSTSQESSSQNAEEPKFQAFTGKKYSLRS